MVAHLILRTFAGGEARLTWQSLPSPRRDKSEGGEVQTVVVKKDKPEKELAPPPPLVNSCDSEEGLTEGVSGFGGLPRQTGFGLNARRQVKRLAAVLDGLADKPQDLIFFTGTLPGSTPQAMLALSQWSGFVVHRMKAWMHDLDSEYKCLSVWEWQKRGALHIHMAIYVKDVDKRNAIYDGLKMQWVHLLESVSDKSGIDLFRKKGGRGTWRGHYDTIRARAEWVKKSVATYLGKYMSKAVSPGKEKGKFFCPSRWWGSTQNLKNLEKAARTEDEYFCSSTGQAEGAYNSVVGLVDLLSDWSATYKHKVMPGATTVACNASVPLLRRLFTRGLSMRSLNENKGLRETADEFQALMWLLHNEDSEWFAGLTMEYSAISTYMRKVAQNDLSNDVVPDQAVLYLNSAAYMLNYAATAGKVYRTKRLHPREVLSIKQTYRRVSIAVEEYLAARYSHSLEQMEYVGRPV